MRKKYKVFLGSQEIAGMMKRLNNAFHEMGIKSDFYCLMDYSFSDQEDENYIIRKYKIHTQKRNNAENLSQKKKWDVIQMLDIIYIFFYSILHYNCYIYIFGHGLFYHNYYLRKHQWMEFAILKLLRKKMVMWCCGSDTRAPYCDVDVYSGDYEKMYSDVIAKRKKVQMLERYMPIIDFPASSHFHTKPYIIYNCIGVPVDEKERVIREKKNNSKVTILHAPSNKQGKGTGKIREILKEIKADGYEFDYIEVFGQTHAEVLKQIVKTDIVVDQLYCDTPMAGFATEASINGTVVIVGGYYAADYKAVLPEPIAPTVFCEPEQLKDNIINMIVDKSERDNIGKKERKYVEENCMASIVAKKFLGILDGNIPDSYFFNPMDNDYIWGCAISKSCVIANVVELINRYGLKALGLNNQKLIDKYMKIYQENK